MSRLCCLLLLWILMFLQQAFAATPLVELINPPNSQQQLAPGQSNILYFTLRNNTTKTFPLNVKLSTPSLSVATQGNTCGGNLPAHADCVLPILFQAPAVSQSLTLLIEFDYHGRAPIGQILTYNIDSQITCTLLPVASYQTAFCQQQYQQVLLNVDNLFNPTNQNVIPGQAPGGVIGLYQKQNNTDLICYVSCGVRVLNGVAPNEKTGFELASVTKTFTGSVLGKLVHLGSINPLTSINGSLPSGNWTGSNGNQHYALNTNEVPVTFQQLATFSGGFCYSDAPSVVLSDATEEKQSDFVYDINLLNPASSICEPTGGANVKSIYGAPNYLPTKNFYSNSSFGLLGQVLMHLSGYTKMDQDDFNNWMCQHILTPTAMAHTTACLPNEISTHTCDIGLTQCNTTDWQNITFAQGYEVSGSQFTPRPAFPFVPWAAAGNLRSTAEDMIIYLQLNLGVYNSTTPAVTALMAGMQLAHQSNDYLIGAGNPAQPQHNLGKQNPLVGGQGYAWVCMPNDTAADAICGKIGGHNQFRSFVGFSQSKLFGVVILVNSGDGSSGEFRFLQTPPTPAQLGVSLIKAAQARPITNLPRLRDTFIIVN